MKNSKCSETYFKLALRLAKNSEIVISHDTNWDLAIWPEDWKRTRNSPEPRIDGRRIFTDKTQTPWASFIQVMGLFNDSGSLNISG